MKFKQYIYEGDDISSLGMRVIKRIMTPKFDKIKSAKQLDQYYNALLKTSRRWNWSNISKEEAEWIDTQFDKTSKRLGVKKYYRIGGKGKSVYEASNHKAQMEKILKTGKNVQIFFTPDGKTKRTTGYVENKEAFIDKNTFYYYTSVGDKIKGSFKDIKKLVAK